MSAIVLTLLCLTAVDAEMLFEVVFVFECFPTLQTFELPAFHALIQRNGILGGQDISHYFYTDTQSGINFRV